MNPAIFDDIALEQNAKQLFGMKLEVDHTIARSIPVGHTVAATVFLTTKKQLYAYIDGHATTSLGDVKKILSRMGLVTEFFVPPKGQPQYFDDIAREKFTQVFPGRMNPSQDDLYYYKTLAPYRPALVQILEIKNGEIFQFDTDSSTGWRLAAKFAYRRIKTS